MQRARILSVHGLLVLAAACDVVRSEADIETATVRPFVRVTFDDKATLGALGCLAVLEPGSSKYDELRSVETSQPLDEHGPATSGGYLHTTARRGDGVTFGIVCVQPIGVPGDFAFANWFTAATPQQPHHAIDGAFDFFMRVNVPMSRAPRVGLLKLNGEELGLELARRTLGGSGWETELACLDNEDGFQLPSGQFAKIVEVVTSREFDVDKDVPVHIAIAFRTDDEGMVELRTWLKRGTEAIDTSLAPDSRVVFDIREDVIHDPEVPNTDAFSFGIRVIEEDDLDTCTTFDFDELRIWDSVPARIPGILDL